MTGSEIFVRKITQVNTAQFPFPCSFFFQFTCCSNFKLAQQHSKAREWGEMRVIKEIRIMTRY